MTTQLEHRVIPLHAAELKFAGSTPGYFEGYGANTGNLDDRGDVIERGAFAASLREWERKNRFPPMLLQHAGLPFGGPVVMDDLLPIGKWLSMEEDSQGLKVSGQLFALNTDRGQYIYEGLKSGVLDGLSIGYRARKSAPGAKAGERRLQDVDLKEVSVVTFPANDKSRISAVKSLTVEQLRDLEEALGERGLSRKDRENAVSLFKQWLQRDPGVPDRMPRDEVVPGNGDALESALRVTEMLCVAGLRHRY